MIRLQILFIVFFVTNGVTAYISYNYAKGKQAVVENKVIKQSIENHNEDIKEIAKHTKEVDKVRIIYRDRIVKMDNIPVNDANVTTDCHLRDYSSSLRNETYRAFPSMYFQSTDSMPSPTN